VAGGSPPSLKGVPVVASYVYRSPNQTRLPVSRGGKYTRDNPAKNKGPVTSVTGPLPFPVSVIRALPGILCTSLPRLSSTIAMKIISPS